MMNVGLMYLLPLVFALFGWLIARVLIYLYVSGIVKRKSDIGLAIGNYVEQQVSLEAVEANLTNPANIEKILPFADEHVENFLRVKLPAAMPMLTMFITDKLVADMKGIFMNELKELFPALILQYTGGIKEEVHIARLVSGKINNVSGAVLKPFLRKQLRIVEISSALTGFLCGCLTFFLTPIA